MRTIATLAATTAVAAALIATASPAQAMGFDPAAKITSLGFDSEGRTHVVVKVDNTASSMGYSFEVVRTNTKTHKWGSRYVKVDAHKATRLHYRQTPGQEFRYKVSAMDATVTAKTVHSVAPITPTATLRKRECAGVGTLSTFIFRNPMGTARKFKLSVWIGDGSGEVRKTVRVPAHSRELASVQQGGTRADAFIELASGRDLMSRFIDPLC